MPARRTVSIRQMELLVEFAESHREIALGRFPGGPQAVRTVRVAWESIALKLNSVANGTTKTPDQWRRYWIEFKAKTKGKAADSRRNASATGGGRNKLVPLNEMEKRVLALIGPVAVEGLPGVRLPSNIPSVDEPEGVADYGITGTGPANANTSTTMTQSATPYSSIIGSEDIASESIMEVEWLDEMVPSPVGVEPASQTFTPPPSAVEMSSVSAGSETQPSDTGDIPTQNISESQPDVSSRENRQTQDSTRPARSSRSQRHLPRTERAPRWAYELENRRIAAEERLAAAVEAGVQLIREIRDDVRSYVHRLG